MVTLTLLVIWFLLSMVTMTMSTLLVMIMDGHSDTFHFSSPMVTLTLLVFAR
jgi:hypothetical protein